MHMQITGREARKLNDKQRKLQETAARNKLDALRDDDDVFDVSYERQGGGAEDTVSATDIKVRPARSAPSECISASELLQHGCGMFEGTGRSSAPYKDAFAHLLAAHVPQKYLTIHLTGHTTFMFTWRRSKVECPPSHGLPTLAPCAGAQPDRAREGQGAAGEHDGEHHCRAALRPGRAQRHGQVHPAAPHRAKTGEPCGGEGGATGPRHSCPLIVS